jgi:hypothetical protein
MIRRGMITNYNHDGIAEHLCPRFHRVLSIHGTIESEYGSPETAAFLNTAREYHLSEIEDDLLMGVSERFSDISLISRLLEMETFFPEFIAIIGYSFARRQNGHDDLVSLSYFQKRYRKFQGEVYIIDPYPEYLEDKLAGALSRAHVVGVRARWNVLSYALIKKITDQIPRSLNYIHEEALDRYGDRGL